MSDLSPQWVRDTCTWPTPDQALALGPAKAAALARQHLEDATAADLLAAYQQTRATWHRTVAARLAAAHPTHARKGTAP